MKIKNPGVQHGVFYFGMAKFFLLYAEKLYC